MLKKFTALFIVCTLLFSLSACGGGNSSENNVSGGSGSSTANTDNGGESSSAGEGTDVSGKTYEVGEFSLLLPDGWLEIPFINVSSEDKEILTDSISVYKNAPDENSIFSYPGITVTINSAESPPTDAKSMYDDAEDIEPITIGDLQWTGFESDNSGYPIIQMYAEDGDYIFTVIVATERAQGSISLSDSDVVAVISSITATPAE